MATGGSNVASEASYWCNRRETSEIQAKAARHLYAHAQYVGSTCYLELLSCITNKSFIIIATSFNKTLCITHLQLQPLIFVLDTLSCAVRQCSSPPSLENGGYEQGSTVVGAVVTYFCDKDYQLSTDAKTRTCLNDQIWSNEDIMCEKGKIIGYYSYGEHF